MNILRYESAFRQADKTSYAMRKARKKWDESYFGTGTGDTSQRVAYAIVSKIITALFGEYKCISDKALAPLDAKRREVMELLLTGGECFIKPCPTPVGFDFTLIPCRNVLVFGRDGQGNPNHIGTMEQSILGNFYYTLLEKRQVGEDGLLTIENTLYRSGNREHLGVQVALSEHPSYADMPEKYSFDAPIGLGLVRLKTPILNCVDGSPEGVAVFAPAVELIENIDKNEKQLSEEFARAESRILASADLLDRELGLKDHLFVGLDDSPEAVGITVYSPNIREESFLKRKQEYLRNVESIIGLRRGMLSDAQVDVRTATEIASSAGDFSLVLRSYQQVWEQALRQVAELCRVLSELYGLPGVETEMSFDWGNGILYDEDKTWADYKEMVSSGLIAPEVALGWRFGLPSATEAEREKIRRLYM